MNGLSSDKLMAGVPGSEKTLLVRGMPGILLEMSIEESPDVTRIYIVIAVLSQHLRDPIFIIR
jgi:predicted ATPase with chaperone activity